MSLKVRELLASQTKPAGRALRGFDSRLARAGGCGR